MRKLQLLFVLLLTALSFNASALDPRIRCGNFCWWNWQHICPIDNPNNLDYCSRGYLTCLQYWGQTPDDCVTGPGVGGEGPMVNCPIYINLGEPGAQLDFGLTSAQNGVYFDLNNDGTPEKTAWASQTSTAALLVRPNEDGSITSGRNLFGNQSGWANGYDMLESFYDSNGDGAISAEDDYAGELYLWTDGQGGVDAIRDGVAQPGELTPFLSVIERLSLHDRTTGQADEYGNEAKWVSHAKLVKTAGGKGRMVRVADWILRFVGE